MNERNNIDFELIMSLAEGTLPPEEAQAAEQALDDAALAELEAQRLALAALGEAPAITLTAAERQALRGSVRDALHLSPAMPTAPASPAPRLWRWLPGLAGAAALVLVIGVGASVIQTGGDDAAEDATAAEAPTAALEATSEMLGATEADQNLQRGADDAAEAEEAFVAPEEAAADESAGTEATEAATTTAAAAETTLAEGGDGDLGFTPQLVATDLGDLESSDLRAIQDAIDRARVEAGDAFPYDVRYLEEATASIDFVCWPEVADLDADLVLLTGFAIVDGADSEVYVLQIDDDARALAYRIGDCALAFDLSVLP